MPELRAPTTAVHASFLQARDEFTAQGRGVGDDRTTVGQELRERADTWTDAGAFARYVESVVADSRPDSPRPPGYVPATTLWWVEGDVYLGRIAIRHTLTAWLREQGGHVGYDVRPSARRQGHATAMLRAALPVAARLGLARVLVTCDADNVASRKVIQACGGILEDRRADKLRYWIDTPV
jgi:predicted acetyltransferase